VTSDRQGRIESTIMQAMSSVPTVNESPISEPVSSVPTVQWLPGACACDSPCVTSDRQGRIESPIMQAMSSVPTVNESPMQAHRVFCAYCAMAGLEPCACASPCDK
jgi:hypothetical protein